MRFLEVGSVWWGPLYLCTPEITGHFNSFIRVTLERYVPKETVIMTHKSFNIHTNMLTIDIVNPSFKAVHMGCILIIIGVFVACLDMCVRLFLKGVLKLILSDTDTLYIKSQQGKNNISVLQICLACSLKCPQSTIKCYLSV